jgi:hypothetical protein
MVKNGFGQAKSYLKIMINLVHHLPRKAIQIINSNFRHHEKKAAVEMQKRRCLIITCRREGV